MMVVIANELPPAVRGRMKLWFIEPRPNVFVSGIKDDVSRRVVEYLFDHCTEESGVMMVRSKSRAPGYEISVIGTPRKELAELSGMQLVIETLKKEKSQHIEF